MNHEPTGRSFLGKDELMLKGIDDLNEDLTVTIIKLEDLLLDTETQRKGDASSWNKLELSLDHQTRDQNEENMLLIGDDSFNLDASTSK